MSADTAVLMLNDYTDAARFIARVARRGVEVNDRINSARNVKMSQHLYARRR